MKWSFLAWSAWVVSALGANRSHAQCDDWRAGAMRAVEGVDGSVLAAIMWDADGSGPIPAQLVIGGYFTLAAGVQINGIARWDGARWQPLGTGLGPEPNSRITAMAIWHPNGQGTQPAHLVVGGYFQSIGGVAANNVAWWDGSSWHAFRLGVDTYVNAVAAWDPSGTGTGPEQVVVGSGVGNASGSSTSTMWRPAVFQWNGVNWVEQGTNVAGAFSAVLPFVGVRSLMSWTPASGGPLLIAGGDFEQIGSTQTRGVAAWNGSSWQALGASFSDAHAHALTTWDPDGPGPLGNELVAAGSFQDVGTSSMHSVVRWNGSGWHGVGTDTAAAEPIQAVIVSDPDGGGLLPAQLLRGLPFTSAGTTYPLAQRWDGSAWVPMGPTSDHVGTHVLVNWDPDGAGVQPAQPVAAALAINVAGDHIYHGGIWHWDGTTWQPFAAPPPKVYSIATLGSRIVYGGDFSAQIPGLAGSIYSPNIVTWDGLKVTAVGTGVNGVVRAFDSSVSGPTLQLFVGGLFTTAGDLPALNVAQWSESQFTGASGWSSLGAGLNGQVFALERSNGSLYAGGAFSASGANPAADIARWDGAAWQPVGTGLNNSCLALKAFSSGPTANLVVGGAFTTAGGVAANRVAIWSTNTFTNSSSWSAMGSGFNGSVFAIERYNNATYAAGSFTSSGATPVSHIARWDGTAWQPVGTGINGTVRSLLSESGYLYAGGAFTIAGGVSATNLARWDGASWTSVRGGADSTVFSLAAYHGEVHVGGDFASVRSGATASTGVGRYLETGTPWIADQPPSTQRGCWRGTTSISATVADGYGGLTFAWRRNGITLLNGPTGTGSSIAGVTNATLDIQQCSNLDSGTYDCVVSTVGCGSVTSFSTILTVCAADFNCDSNTSVQDIFDFLAAWFSGSNSADINGTSGVTVQDIFDFLAAWFAGC